MKNKFIIESDQVNAPTLPLWVKRRLHPEPQSMSPKVYDLSLDVGIWLHESQQHKQGVEGLTIYEHLKDTGDISFCLGLQDGIAIQKKDTETFHSLFSDKLVFLWRDIIEDEEGHLVVPYLYETCGGVLQWWCGLHSSEYRLVRPFGITDVALRFKKQQFG